MTHGLFLILPPRLVQLGFLRKTGQFFGQAAAQKDPKAQQLLAHSVWHLSATLTDIKPLEPQPPPRPHPHRHPPTDSGSPAFTGEAISALSRGGLQQHQQQYKGVRRRSSSNSVLLPGQGESATTTAKSSTITAARNNQGAARGTYGSRNRRRSSGGSSVVSVSVSEANTVRSSRASVRPVDRARGSVILRKNSPGGALSAARGGLVGGRKLVRRRSSTLTEEEGVSCQYVHRWKQCSSAHETRSLFGAFSFGKSERFSRMDKSMALIVPSIKTLARRRVKSL